MPPEPPEPRNGITSLLAAFNIADGTVIGELHRRHRAVEFQRFLTRIDKTVPEGLDVHVICDNYGTHKTPAVRGGLGGIRGSICTSPRSARRGSTRSCGGLGS